MKKQGLGTVLLAGSLLLTGCGGDSDGNSSSDRASDTQATASVRALHLSPDAPAVDIAVSGNVVLEDVSYREASGFLTVDAATTPIDVLVAGTDTRAIAASLPLNEDTKYTVIAVNELASIEPLVITDVDTPAEGFAELTVIHGAPAAPAVDVYVSGPDDDFAGLTPLLEGVVFKDVSNELEVAAGDYRVRVTAAGGSDILYDSGTLNLADGVEYVAVASQVDEGFAPIGLTLLTDLADTPVVTVDDARARVRVIHASADAPAVDVDVNDAEVLGDVTFGNASSYLKLLGDTYNVKVLAADSESAVINTDLTLDPRQDYSVLALNTLSEIEALVLADDNSAPAEGSVKVRLVHAASQAGLVDVYVTAPGADIGAIDPTIEDFAFKEDSGYLEVPAGDYRVRVTLADTKTVAIDTGTLSLGAGIVRTAIALDPEPGGSEFGALLLEDLN
ncbi:MAG: DUF4397 domain-containing protein [Ketobacteraceae bacterium]|nr:DUF4397 domain-containing protein [Ketobacteraceae bacterium]